MFYAFLCCDDHVKNGFGDDEYFPSQILSGIRSKTSLMREARKAGWSIGKKHICDACRKLSPRGGKE